MHLCRNSSCAEEGQHFKQYAVVKPFNPEAFQLASASAGAQQAGQQMFQWFGKRATTVVQKAKDLASESEPDQPQCDAGKIAWEDSNGRQLLHGSLCTEGSCTEVSVLEEDSSSVAGVCHLCPKHHNQYLKTRFQLKCAISTCNRLGCSTVGGLRLCHDHAQEGSSAPPPTSRTPQRSRSRSRARQPEVEFEEDYEEPQQAVRRRRRAQQDAEEEQEDPPGRTRTLLDEVRAEDGGQPSSVDRRRKRRQPEGSPGHTPKSGVQRSLAKMGLINSPDRCKLSALEEYMEQMADGRELGLEEEDVRMQMASSYGYTLVDFTKILYEQATEEQRKGTKGLTKFLAKWRRQIAANTPEKSRADSWSLVGTTPEGSTPKASKPPESSSSRPTTPVRPTFAVLPPPGIYGKEDRKAGTGASAEPMTEIAKAIQQQTSELATLVKTQQEQTAVQGGTMKGRGRPSEELVFLLRACGQYTVEVGAGEHGAALATALVAAQAGASTKLRDAGFRQKVTQRLAIGLAGPYWGTQEKYALAAADFIAHTDAELDQFAVECRTGKQINDQRPPAPTRFEDWQSRVRRQNSVWALVWPGVVTGQRTCLGQAEHLAPTKPTSVADASCRRYLGGVALEVPRGTETGATQDQGPLWTGDHDFD